MPVRLTQPVDICEHLHGYSKTDYIPTCCPYVEVLLVGVHPTDVHTKVCSLLHFSLVLPKSHVILPHTLLPKATLPREDPQDLSFTGLLLFLRSWRLEPCPPHGERKGSTCAMVSRGKEQSRVPFRLLQMYPLRDTFIEAFVKHSSRACLSY